MRKLEHLKPERVFYYFEEISKIPRESYHEKKMSEYLMDFGKKHGLECYRDASYNVVLRKKAYAGCENAPGVILQGHMDMVCEKEEDSTHNFDTDPLDLIVNGNYLTANKTTLGADNGIAVAMGLAILESNEIVHGPLEMLVTTSEEVDLGGAMALGADVLKGCYFINIDSEEEGIITVGCAGGENIAFLLPVAVTECGYLHGYTVKVQNLTGGHSGSEIHQNRANANKVMGELLKALKAKTPIVLASVTGGSKDNAIPRVSQAVIASEQDIETLIYQTITAIKRDYLSTEPQSEILVYKTDAPKTVFSADSFNEYLGLVEDIPTGVYSWMQEYANIVETSDNLAIVAMEEAGLKIEVSMRSSNPDGLKELKERMVMIAQRHKVSYVFSADYPAWKFRKNSVLRDKAVSVWKNVTGNAMQVSVIHAGLECGAIAEKYPYMDCISIGPNMQNVHTPEERLEIKSTGIVYEYLLALLKELV